MSQPRGRSKNALIAAIVAVVLVGAGVGAYFLFAGNGRSSPVADSPRSSPTVSAPTDPGSPSNSSAGVALDETSARMVVKAYLQAVADQDLTEAEPLICSTFLDAWKSAHSTEFSVGISHIDFTFHHAMRDRPSSGLDLSYTLRYAVDSMAHSDDVHYLVVQDAGLKICAIQTVGS